LKKEAIILYRWKHLDTQGEPEFSALFDQPLEINGEADYKRWTEFREDLAERIASFATTLKPKVKAHS